MTATATEGRRRGGGAPDERAPLATTLTKGSTMTILWKQTRGSRWAVRAHYRARELPPYDAMLRHGHRLSRLRHREDLPTTTGALQELRRDLRAHGVAQRPLEALGVPIEATVAAADRLCADLRLLPSDTGVNFHVASDDDLIREPEPYLFGLSAPLLDFVEHYMGLPVNYLGVNVKREIANGVRDGTRNFHQDPEDENVLKIIVYLSDVDVDSGPFQCLDASDSSEVTSSRRRLRRPLQGLEDIARIVPPDNWVTCLGPRLTANIADTARCLHRVSPPLTTDRYSMTFSYLSRRSYLVFAEGVELQARFMERWSSVLDARQSAALAPPKRSFGRRSHG
jgi:hypothetical protein